MPVKPYVSIVLPTYQGAKYLKETLPAIANQDLEEGFEIVAIDSQSGDETPTLLKEAGARFFSIPQSEFGHGSTRNFGVQQAQGELIVFLSQDAVPVGPNWLRDLIEPVRKASVGAAYARQLPRQNSTPIERYMHKVFYPARGYKVRQQQGEPLSLDKLFFSNVCSVARREVCERFPFDETLIMSEDQVFSRDILASGLEIVYNAKAKVIHSHHYTLGALFRRNFDSGYSLRTFQSGSPFQQISRIIMFLSREILFLTREKQFGWLLYLPLYEAVRFLALLLGTQAERIPLKSRIALSLHRSYWEKQRHE